MTTYKTIAALLKDRFPGISQRRIAERLGVEHTSVARWFRPGAKAQPSMDSCLRIARACGIDPHLVFSIAGLRARDFSELFDFYQGRPAHVSDLYRGEPSLARLAVRSETLFRRGMEQDLNHALVQLEQVWEIRRTDFELLLKECDADAGCLIVDHLGLSNDLFYQINCRSSDLDALTLIHGSSETPAGWDFYSHEEFEIVLRLFIKDAQPIARDTVESTLHMWSFGFSRLLGASQ